MVCDTVEKNRAFGCHPVRNQIGCRVSGDQIAKHASRMDEGGSVRRVGARETLSSDARREVVRGRLRSPHRAGHLELRGVVRLERLFELVHQRGPLIGPILLGHAFQPGRLRVAHDVVPEHFHHHARHEVQLLSLVGVFLLGAARHLGREEGGTGVRSEKGANP